MYWKNSKLYKFLVIFLIVGYINNSKYRILSILPSMKANMANNRGYIGHGVQHTRFLSFSMKIKQIFGYILDTLTTRWYIFS